jgi:argonaute-like protein implicated in RNA metabolism and viral defense
MKQFQGKQNCKIPESVYTDLEAKFTMYRLLLDSDNPTIKYSKITKQHILMFLKELKYAKQYENVNVIYSTITGKSVDNISHIEKYLLEDFKELVTLYDNLHSKDKSEELDRKNFLNVQYLLFQLLRRHGYNCKIDEFAILKTTDRKMFHDKICCNLFRHLGWNFTPVF